MRKIVLVLAVLFFCGATGFAIDYMGPPSTELKPNGQRPWYTLGLNYSFSQMDYEASGYGYSPTIEDVEMSRYSAIYALGLADGWEFNARIGATDIEADDAQFNSSARFTWGVGTKATFVREEDIDWGALFQIDWIRAAQTDRSLADFGLGSGTYDIEVDAYEIQVAIGPTLKSGDWKFYGGPFFYMLEGDLDGTSGSTTLTFDIEEDSSFGGYIGTEFNAAENTSLTLEYAMTGDGWGLAGGVAWRF